MPELVAVQNGTEIASATYVALVTKYRTFAKQTAESIVRLAETLVEAKRKLLDEEFRDFCEEVGLQHEGSTYKKLIKIGEEISRFEPFFDRMPNSWTTVYKLATLKQDIFDRVTTDTRFVPTMTGAELNQILGSKGQTASISRDVTIDLTGGDRGKKVEVCVKVRELLRPFGFKMELSNDLQKELEPKQKPNLLDYLQVE